MKKDYGRREKQNVIIETDRLPTPKVHLDRRVHLILSVVSGIS